MGTGKVLKALLKEKKMQIKDLAEKANVSVNTLYAITRRDPEGFSDVFFRRLFPALEMRPPEIVAFLGRQGYSARIEEDEGRKVWTITKKSNSATSTSAEVDYITDKFSNLTFFEYADFMRWIISQPAKASILYGMLAEYNATGGAQQVHSDFEDTWDSEWTQVIPVEDGDNILG